MRTYAAEGRCNLALKQYELCRDALQRELGLQPEPETQALYKDVRARRMMLGKEPRPAHGQLEAKPPRPQTHYVKSTGCNIAYQVTGDGPIDMIYVPGWVSNLDHHWESPRVAHVFQRLGSFCRLIRCDKRGTGLSDRGVRQLRGRQHVHAVRRGVSRADRGACPPWCIRQGPLFG